MRTIAEPAGLLTRANHRCVRAAQPASEASMTVDYVVVDYVGHDIIEYGDDQ